MGRELVAKVREGSRERSKAVLTRTNCQRLAGARRDGALGSSRPFFVNALTLNAPVCSREHTTEEPCLDPGPTTTTIGFSWPVMLVSVGGVKLDRGGTPAGLK